MPVAHRAGSLVAMVMIGGTPSSVEVFYPMTPRLAGSVKNFLDVIRKWNGRVALGELHQKTAKQHRWRRRSEATVPSMPRHNIGAGMD